MEGGHAVERWKEVRREGKLSPMPSLGANSAHGFFLALAFVTRGFGRGEGCVCDVRNGSSVECQAVDSEEVRPGYWTAPERSPIP